MTSDPPFSKFARPISRRETRDTSFCGFAGHEPTWAPSVNLYEARGAYHVCVDLAGIDKKTVDVSVRPSGDLAEPVRLVIAGVRPVPQPPVAGRYAAARVKVHRMELDNGPFCREIELPADVEQGGITASYHGGLLWVVLPKDAAGGD